MGNARDPATSGWRHSAATPGWRSWRSYAFFDRQTSRQPGGIATIEHGNLLHTDQPQQPPQPRRGQRAAGCVVTDHLHASTANPSATATLA
jgi:hypothetical protein